MVATTLPHNAPKNSPFKLPLCSSPAATTKRSTSKGAFFAIAAHIYARRQRGAKALSGGMGRKSVVALILACAVGLLVPQSSFAASLGAPRDEVTGLPIPAAIAFSDGRAYVADARLKKIISYAVETDGRLGEARDEVTTGLSRPLAIAFSGGRAYVADRFDNKIISYAVATDGRLGEARDEVTTGLYRPLAIAFSGDRVYVVASIDSKGKKYKIISYAVEINGRLGEARDEARDEIALSNPFAIAFSGGRAYVADNASDDEDKIISYAVGADGILGEARDEVTTGLREPFGIAFSGGRAYVVDRGRDKIVSYDTLDASGVLGAGRDEITATRSSNLRAIAFSGERAYVADSGGDKIISYPLFSSVQFVVAPDAPRVVAQSDSEIEIAWNAVLGATHYKIYRSETSGGLFAQVGGDISGTRYRDGGLSGGAFYYYELEACNGNECSGRSPEVSAATYAAGSLGAGRDEITTGLSGFASSALAFFGGRVYVANAAENESKILSYAVGAGGELGARRDEITVGLSNLSALAFSGGRVYAVNSIVGGEIISYPVGTGGILGSNRREITTGLSTVPLAIAFSGGRAYVTDAGISGNEDKIISYAVGADGELGAGRDEISGLLFAVPIAIAFSGGRAYVLYSSPGKIISYAVGADGELGAGRDEIPTTDSIPLAFAFSSGRAYAAYIVNTGNDGDIISYAVGADGELGAGRGEITDIFAPSALAFSGERAYVFDADFLKIISYPLFSSIPFAVAPDAPRVFTQSGSEIEIAWNAVLEATHYKLYRSETSGGLFAQVEGDISITRYRDGNLSANTSYYYQLEACNGDECSGSSPEVSATTDASGASGSRGAAGADDAAAAVAKRQRDSNPIVSSLEACNGDECSQRSPEVLTATRSASKGVFHASGWVVGLDYQYGDGETGKTGEKGAFPLRSGQTVVFSTGQVTLGAVSIAADANADFFTPTRLGDQARAIRIERLLIALDSDGENDNGVVSLNAESASDALTAWNAARASDDEATTPINGRMRAIPSAATAATLLKRANNCGFSGAFAGRWTDADGNGGEHAMVLLAFNEGDIDGVSNPRGVFAGIDQITGGNSRNGKALWIKLWNQGGGLQSVVTKYGAASGALSIDLSAFPVVATMTASNGVVMTITVESYGKIGYAVGGESGVLSRVRQEIPNADYRLAGFYSNDDRATPPGEQKPEIGIFAASIDGESEKLEPYIGRFLTDGAVVYSNIGHSNQDAAYTRQGTPADGTITIVAADGREIELRFTEQRDGVGYGAYEDMDANGDDGFDVFGGWCKL